MAIALLLSFLQGCSLFRDAPVAVIAASETTGRAPLVVYFDGSQSYDRDGTIVNWEWDFGGGYLAEGPQAQQAYATPGVKSVALQVTDNSGLTSSTQLDLEILPQEFQAVAHEAVDLEHGSEYRDGDGLKIEVPPASASGSAILTCAKGLPSQMNEVYMGVELLSVYAIALDAQMSTTLATMSDRSVGSIEVLVSIEIPEGVSPHDVCILEWHASGWQLANSDRMPSGVSQLGGTLSNDSGSVEASILLSTSESIPQSLITALSMPSEVDFDKLVAIGNLGAMARRAATKHFTGPERVAKRTYRDGDAIVVEVDIKSPQHSFWGGAWYRGAIVLSEGLAAGPNYSWQPANPYDPTLALALAIDPEGFYLSPSSDKDAATLTIRFGKNGGQARVHFDAALGYFPWAMQQTAGYGGVPVELLAERSQEINEAIDGYWEGVMSGDLGVVGAFRQLGKVLWEALPETIAKAVWEGLTSWKGPYQAAAYLEHLVSDSEGQYWMWVRADDSGLPGSTLGDILDVTIPADQAESQRSVTFLVDIDLDDTQPYFTATIEPGGDTYSSRIDASGPHLCTLYYTTPSAGSTLEYTVQGQMTSTRTPKRNSDSETVVFQVTAEDMPDLTVPMVLARSEAYVAGDQLEVEYELANNGGSLRSDVKAALYLSEEPWGTGESVHQWSIGAGSWNAEGTIDSSLGLTVPTGYGGSYYLTLYLDVNDEHSESNENNNIGSTYPHTVFIESAPDASLVSVEVTGPSEAAEDTSVGFTCTAHYSNGDSKDVTAQSSWSDDSSYASFSSPGHLHVDELPADRSCTITAEYSEANVTEADSMTISLRDGAVLRTLESIEIGGSTVAPEKSTTNYTCTASYSDGSERDVTGDAEWSENSSAASFSSPGRLKVEGLLWDRSCTITVTFSDGEETATDRLSITLKNGTPEKVLERIEIAGPSSADENTTVSFSCTAYYSSGDPQVVTSDATWGCNCSYAEFEADGQLRVNTLSSDRGCTISATYSDSAGSASDSVVVQLRNVESPKYLESIEIDGPSQISENTSAQFECIAHFSDSSSETVTESVTWVESCPWTEVSDLGLLVVGEQPHDRECEITASYSYGGARREDELGILLIAAPDPVTLDSIEIAVPAQVFRNCEYDLTCTATLTNGDELDATTDATWEVIPYQLEATVTQGGHLAIGDIHSSEADCHVQVKYEYGGVEKTAVMPVRVVYTEPGHELVNVEIQGPSEVFEDSETEYACIAYFADGDRDDVHWAADWDLGSSYASVDEHGVVKVLSLSQSRNATLNVEYEHDGRVRTDSKQLRLTDTPGSQVGVTFYAQETQGSQMVPVGGVEFSGTDGDGQGFVETTDSAGYAYAVGSPGRWWVDAIKSGYYPENRDYPVSDCFLWGFEMRPITDYASLDVYVFEDSSQSTPVVGATVAVSMTSGEAFEGQTNSEGLVIVSGAEGDWTFTVTKAGYGTIAWRQIIYEETAYLNLWAWE